ncbi:MAG: DUF2227 family putative metal-binding protein [Chloroflexota bacterium]
MDCSRGLGSGQGLRTLPCGARVSGACRPSHLTLELGTLPLWVVAGACLGVPQDHLMVFSLSYATSSLLLSPDLDLQRTDPARRWGPLRRLWFPYTLVFRHRGLSHSPLWGPLTRVGYLLALVAAAWASIATFHGSSWDIPRLNVHLPPLVAGMYVPHLLHVALDKACSRRHRKLR